MPQSGGSRIGYAPDLPEPYAACYASTMIYAGESLA
jgi:hypothetical protein